MRIAKKRKVNIRQTVKTLSAFLIIVMAVGIAYKNAYFIAQTARNAAVISATIAMPDSGLEIFEKRFADEIMKDNEQQPLPPLTDKKAAEDYDSRQEEQEQEQEHTPPINPNDFTPHTPDNNARNNQNTPIRIPTIPQQYKGDLLSGNYAGKDNGNYIKYNSGYIKNDTEHSDSSIINILKEDFNVSFSDDDSPQVLIYHTHATESFEKYDTDVYDTRNTWRSTDNNNNIVYVGNIITEVLEEYGIGVIHDTTQHDYPSYNGSYQRSAVTVSEYLEQYPSIKVVLDVHRDAMATGDSIIKPVTEINGRKAAQIMIISGCDDGTMNMPNWKSNLRFAAEFQSYMEENSPQLTRPVFFCYRKYNMDLSPGALLLEFGSNANTLEEVEYSAELSAHALANLIIDYTVE